MQLMSSCCFFYILVPFNWLFTFLSERLIVCLCRSSFFLISLLLSLFSPSSSFFSLSLSFSAIVQYIYTSLYIEIFVHVTINNEKNKEYENNKKRGSRRGRRNNKQTNTAPPPDGQRVNLHTKWAAIIPALHGCRRNFPSVATLRN